MNIKRSLIIPIISMLSIASILGACSSEEEGQTTIEVWAMGEEGNLLNQLVDQFEEEHEDIKVQVQPIPWDQAHEKLLTATASGNGPDVLQLGTTWVPEFAEAGILLDLSPYLEEYPDFANSNYFDGAVESTEYEGKRVGVPWYVETRVLYYRTDLLAEVGYEQAPQNWDELKDVATKLTAQGDHVFGYDIDMNDAIVPVIFAWQNGNDFIVDGKPDVRSDAFAEALEFYVSFFEEGLASSSGQIEIIQAFKEGIKPIFQSGPWMIRQINEQAPEIEGDWSVAVLPEKENNLSVMGGANLSIFHNSDKVDESLTFISFLNDVDTQIEWFGIANSLPSRMDAWDSPELQATEQLTVIGDQMLNTKASPQITQWDSLHNEIVRMVEKIVVGGADFDEELEAFRVKVDEMFD